jgi:hypothetical protein
MAKSKTEEASANDALPVSGGDGLDVAAAASREPVIYCGPSVPKGKITSGSLYRGGLPNNIGAMIEKIPEIGKLTVPVSRLAETHRKIAVAGTEENRLYQAILQSREAS